MAFTTPPSRLLFTTTPPHLRPTCFKTRRPLHISPRPNFRAQLIGMPEGSGKSIQPDENEILLAELRYSPPEKLPSLVQNALPNLNEDFYNYLDRQINSSSDLEERETLRTLRDAITDIMKQLYEAVNAEQSEKENENESASSAQSLQMADSESDIAQATYDQLIDQLASAADVKVAVSISYERVDMRLLERLAERIATDGESGKKLGPVRDAINSEMNTRMQKAMQNIKQVLSATDSANMQRSVDTLARKGELDDAFVLLLQANLDQAKSAGAQPAVQVMQSVLQYATNVKEAALDPEIRLIRALLRTEQAKARVEMLMTQLKPRKAVALADGSQTSGVAVEGKKFVKALRRLIEEFGNVDEGFVMKLSKIGEESEMVARKIFNMEGKDVKDLQNEAFHKRSVSVWDLEKVEVEEEMKGGKAGWEGKMGEIPQGFDEKGKMEI